MNAQNRVCRGFGPRAWRLYCVGVPPGVDRFASLDVAWPVPTLNPQPSTLNHFQPSTTSGAEFLAKSALIPPSTNNHFVQPAPFRNWNLELGYSLELGAWTLGASQTARSFSPNQTKFASKPLSRPTLNPQSAEKSPLFTFSHKNKKIFSLRWSKSRSSLGQGGISAVPPTRWRCARRDGSAKMRPLAIQAGCFDLQVLTRWYRRASSFMPKPHQRCLRSGKNAIGI
jgi:hypothetical protein